jgi:hypothetical protein
MQTISMRKASLLGLVLLAASAVTAAIIPSKKAQKVADNNGNCLFPDDGGVHGNAITCTDLGREEDFSCDITAAGDAATDSEIDGDGQDGVTGQGQSTANTTATDNTGAETQGC